MVAGNTDGKIIKLDNAGNKEWDFTFGGETNDNAYAVQQTDDKRYIAAGHADLDGTSTKMYILKLNCSGSKEWDKTLEGGSAYSICATGDGCYIVAGCD
ncbi:MAG: hypothetical protein JSW07_00990 [bacterium]|nr:MAG: hypothetical protein JSW07_00990 [bacterium]